MSKLLLLQIAAPLGSDIIKSNFFNSGFAEILTFIHSPYPLSVCCPSSLLSVIGVASNGKVPYPILAVRFLPLGPLFHVPHGCIVRATVESLVPFPLSKRTPKYCPFVLNLKLKSTVPSFIAPPILYLK